MNKKATKPKLSKEKGWLYYIFRMNEGEMCGSKKMYELFIFFTYFLYYLHVSYQNIPASDNLDMLYI